MDIVLVRHGKAVDFNFECSDIDRELTKKGRKEVRRAIPALKKNLKPGQRVVIWTSPAARASQTAQIIADELNIEGMSVFDFIYTGDYEALKNELKYVDDRTTLFVVGHEPYTSLWSLQMIDTRLTFRKGAMAGIEISSRGPLKGELQWQIDPSKIKEKSAQGKSMPEAPHEGEYVTIKDFQVVMIDMINQIRDMREQYLRYPLDVESVHRLRVSIRQARSLLSFLKPVLDSEQYSIYQDKLRTIARKFSYIREIDVLLAQWESFAEKNQELCGCDVLIEILNSEREKENAEAYKYASEGWISDALDSVSSWIRQWDEEYLRENDGEKGQFEEFALKRFEKWNKGVSGALKELDYDELETIHNLRIRFKKVRYVQNNIKLFENNKTLNMSELKKIQDALGEICDSYVNIEIMANLREKYPSGDLVYETGVYTGYLLYFREVIKKKLGAKKD